MPPFQDLKDKKFGKLTVLTRTESAKGRSPKWLCVCDCGGRKVTTSSLLRRGETRSCGCLIGESNRTHARCHGLTDHPLYSVWSSMLTRCSNPRREMFKHYGGRGITVCAEWKDFRKFYTDMAGSYSPGLQLDRTDNSKGYAAANCRWVTPRENARNTRRTRLIETPWGPMTIREASEKSGIKHSTLHGRVYRGEQNLFKKIG